jgi:hypothetical protein
MIIILTIKLGLLLWNKHSFALPLIIGAMFLAIRGHYCRSALLGLMGAF